MFTYHMYIYVGVAPHPSWPNKMSRVELNLNSTYGTICAQGETPCAPMQSQCKNIHTLAQFTICPHISLNAQQKEFRGGGDGGSGSRSPPHHHHYL